MFEETMFMRATGARVIRRAHANADVFSGNSEMNGATHWMNTTAEPITFAVEDAGLGVKSSWASFGGSPKPGWGFELACNGTNASPCPRTVRSGTAGKDETQVALHYDPSTLPTGKDQVAFAFGDPIWTSTGDAAHTTGGSVTLKIDHTAPEVTLSGALTEREKLGTAKTEYPLTITATDGTTAAPQSGVAKVVVKVDGKTEETWTPGCGTENCSFSGTWTLKTSEYTATSHKVEVVVTDAAGVVSEKTIETDLLPPDTTITSGPNGTVTSGKVAFEFTATKPGSHFACSLDGASFGGCTSPKAYEGLSKGTHTFRVRAIDAQGNEDPSPAERNFEVILPPVATEDATQVKADSATLTATINPRGLDTTYQFAYKRDSESGESHQVPASPKDIGAGTEPVNVSEPITGLSLNTTYDYHVIAHNAAGTAGVEEGTFTTIGVPVATTLPASGLTATEATFKATINPVGDATSYYFEYGPDEGGPLTKVPVAPKEIEAGRAAIAVSETVTGLIESQEYRYRVVATNSAGTVEGQFVPLDMLTRPTVTTEAAEAVEGTEAILTGTIEPHGQESTYLFEYGTTPSYGASVPPAEEEIGGATATVPTAEAVAELEPETTYHYRLVATSAAGKTAGVDQTFTTAPQAQKSSTALPGDFYGLMWSGNLEQTSQGAPRSYKEASESEMNVVWKSGAKMFRLQLHGGNNQGQTAEIFRMAAKRGVRILPYFELHWDWTNTEEIKSNEAFIKAQVAKFGPNGTYWEDGPNPEENGHVVAYENHCDCGGLEMAPTWWEIGNEPNLGKNAPNPHEPYFNPDNPNGDPFEKIFEIGTVFQRYSFAAKAGATERGRHVKILLAGLFTSSASSCDSVECHMSAADFIRYMGHEDSYDGVSLHPYAFKVGEKEPHAPENMPGQTDDLVAKVRANIKTVRSAMVGGNTNKPIWVTEIGFPVESDREDVFPKVAEPTQATLIEKTMKMLAEEHDALGIEHAFLWNIRDKSEPAWDWHCGLRKVNGGFRREAWKAFTGVTGGEQIFPKKPKAKVKGHTTKSGSHAADVLSLINANGLETKYWTKWGQGPISNTFGNYTAARSAGAGFEDVEGANTLTGLKPSTTYHLRVVVESEDGEEGKEESEDVEFTTPPSSSISQEVTRVLHGTNGGYFWVDGWVKEGAIEGSGPGLANVNVHLMLYRNGQYVGMREAHTDAAGHYESGYQSLGKGTYEVKAVFPGGLEWDEAVAPHPETFTIRDGVQIVSRSAGACVDVGGGSSENTAPVHQWPCLNPETAQNQVWTLNPVGEGYFQISARHSGKCLDVSNASQADGAGIQQYDCLGTGQWNQLFREVWNGNYVSYVAKHSQKCLDVPGGGGTPQLVQWTCNGSPEQQFSLAPVESAPIPTETFVNIEQVLGGEPGYVTFSGHLKAGAYGMQGRVVHVILEKNEGGNWNTQANVPMSVNAEGFYQYYDFGVGQGQWRARAVFAGGDVFAGTSSGEHYFTVQGGDHIIGRESNKCLSLSNAQNENFNGQHFLLWDCSGSPSYGDGQVFRFWPSGGGSYEITVVSSGRCVDFANGSTENGGYLQQWDCNHYAQQHFQLLPIAGQEGWYALRPEQSYKCLDVLGFHTNNGAGIGQWDCSWAGNEQWRLEGAR